MVGNISNYTKTDVLRCFLLIEKSLGRAELGKELEMGEGTVKTILSMLKKKGLIISTTHGHGFTKKGADTLIRIKQLIDGPKKLQMRIYPKKEGCAVLLRRVGSQKITLEHRDLAIKNGADAAILLVYSDRLRMPMCDLPAPQELQNLFEFQEGDILIVCFADSYRWADNACLTVAEKIEERLRII